MDHADPQGPTTDGVIPVSQTFVYNAQAHNGGLLQNGSPFSYLMDQSMCPKSAGRRSKRIIPDKEKDDKYWEKRKRNNEAARKSRENKRRQEYDVRARVSYLEEENALLRREVEVIKTKFGLPLDQCFLSAEQKAEVMAIVAEKVLARNEAEGLEDALHDHGGTNGLSVQQQLLMMAQDENKQRKPRSFPIKKDPEDPMGMSYYGEQAPVNYAGMNQHMWAPQNQLPAHTTQQQPAHHHQQQQQQQQYMVSETKPHMNNALAYGGNPQHGRSTTPVQQTGPYGRYPPQSTPPAQYYPNYNQAQHGAVPADLSVKSRRTSGPQMDDLQTSPTQPSAQTAQVLMNDGLHIGTVTLDDGENGKSEAIGILHDVHIGTESTDQSNLLDEVVAEVGLKRRGAKETLKKENNELRSRLQQLTAEVAKMKDFVGAVEG